MNKEKVTAGAIVKCASSLLASRYAKSCVLPVYIKTSSESRARVIVGGIAKPAAASRNKVAHILLVEDDEQVRLLIEEILIMSGHRVAVAETVAAGCTLLDASPSYDLMITDGRLPDGNGLTIAHCATEHGIKVIIISGFLAEYPANQLLPYTTLAKPFRVSQLTTAIAHVLSANG